MQYIRAQNLEKVLKMEHIHNQDQVRVILDSLWDTAVNSREGDIGVVLVTARDVRDHVMNMVGEGKQLVEMAATNSKHTLTQLASILEDAATDFLTADYILASILDYDPIDVFILHR